MRNTTRYLKPKIRNSKGGGTKKKLKNSTYYDSMQNL